MPSTTAGPPRIRFGDFELDERSGELWTNGSCTVLPNQPLRILAALIHRSGALVTREELCRELWPADTYVDFERGLNAGVRRLRDLLGDSAAAPRFIETIPQRGYRFIARVVEDGADTQQAESESPVLIDRAEAGEGAAERPPRGRVAATTGAALVTLMAALAAMHGLRHRSMAADRSAERSLVRLTSTSGLSTDPALSRDGTLLAYASDRAGGTDFDLYVQPVAGGEPLRITADPADDAEPSFSPDGSHIVFSRRDVGVCVVGALGGEPRVIVRAPWARTPRFSPDGRWISYWTGFPVSVVAGGVPNAVGSIFVVASDGGSPRPLLTGLPSGRYPIWSPDGEHILFLGEVDADRKTHDWYVIPRTGGEPLRTGAVQALRAAGLRAGVPVPGAWSADDDAVIFATNETDSSNVWQIPIAPSTGRVRGTPEPLTFGTAVERGATVSESGRIAFASIVENVDVWRLPLDAATGVATGPLERVTDDAATDRLRNVSSNGKSVFFISSRTKNDEVWVKDLETGRERQLTDAATGVEEASASLDGTRVAFSVNGAGRRYIDIVGTADGVASRLCDECYGPAGWSRDGRRLLYSAGGPFRLLMADLASGRQDELARHPTWALERPRFSPDGRWVVFHTANSPDVRQIYSASLHVGVPVPQESWIPVVTDHGCHPSWSPDGALIYYFSFRDGAFCPWAQRVDPETSRPIGPPRAVQHLHHPHLRAATGAAAFNDAQAGYLYMTLTESTGNIWMIDTQRQ